MLKADPCAVSTVLLKGMRNCHARSVHYFWVPGRLGQPACQLLSQGRPWLEPKPGALRSPALCRLSNSERMKCPPQALHASLTSVA